MHGFACGYFLYDLLIVIHTLPNGFEYLLHAVVCGWAYWAAQTPFLQYYTVRFLLFELSTPGINVLRMLKVYNCNKSLETCIKGLTATMFLSCRVIYGFPLGLECINFCLKLLNKPPAGISIDMIYFGIFAVASMCTLNMVWFFHTVVIKSLLLPLVKHKTL